MNISPILHSIVSITLFNKGKASQLFSRVEHGDTLVVVKNNTPISVIVSTAEFSRLYDLKAICSELVNDQNFTCREKEKLQAAIADLNKMGGSDI